MKRTLLFLLLLWLAVEPLTALAQSQQTPITRAARLTGNIDFVATGGSLRTQPNTGNACAVGATSTQTLSAIPVGRTIRAAYLYWGASSTISGGATQIDSSVTLNGSTVTAARTFTAAYDNAGTLLPFFGAVADVTSRITGNGSYTFGGLTINTGAPHCAVAAVTGGWALIVIYQGSGERLRAINLFDGLQLFRGSALTLRSDGFRIPAANIDGRVGVVTWEGDPGNSAPLSGFSESLSFNGGVLDDGLVPAGSDPVVQQYDGTINPQGVVTSYGADVDVYDVSSRLTSGQDFATSVYSAGGDLVLLAAQIVSVTSEPRVDLTLTKTANGPFIVGGTASYSLRVSHLIGSANEREDNLIQVVDTLPAGLTYQSASGAGWGCSAVDQTVSCLHPPVLDPGQSLPDLTLNVRIGAAAYPSVTNTATVSSASLDDDNTNDTASITTAVLRPDLSISTKVVVDLNGGEPDPGDVLRYTITLTESGGAAATGASVLDDVPANVTNFSVVAVPPGSINASTATGGANGNGLLSITGITVPANSSATISFDVRIPPAAGPGTPIDNTASISQPNGPGAAPAAPTLIVSPSRIPGSGSKPLYLRRVGGPNALQLSRNPPSPSETNEGVPGSGSRSWNLTPNLQQAIAIPAQEIAVRLWLTGSGGGGASRSVVVTLANTATGFSTSASQTITPPSSGTPSQFVFTLPNSVVRSFPAGSALTLTVAQTSPSASTSFTRVHSNGIGAGNNSRVELTSNTVINVDSVQAFAAAYPATISPASFAPGSTVHLRAVISDPFGSFDISGATLDLLDSAGAARLAGQSMAIVADDGAATRIYEITYVIPASAPVGGRSIRVTGIEGTEGLVTDIGVGPMPVALAQPQLNVQKRSEVLSDPFNGTVNPKRIPGAIIRYSLRIANAGPGGVDAASLVLADRLPPDASLFVATTAGPPVEFIDGTPVSGLSYSYPAHVSYSTQPDGGAPFNYVPLPDAAGFDAAVTGLRVAPTGSLGPAGVGGDPAFTLRFRVRVR